MSAAQEVPGDVKAPKHVLDVHLIDELYRVRRLVMAALLATGGLRDTGAGEPLGELLEVIEIKMEGVIARIEEARK
jgi:hypothetical protein